MEGPRLVDCDEDAIADTDIFVWSGLLSPVLPGVCVGVGVGFADDQMRGVMVVATSNRPEAVDSALRRPGRFDRELEARPPPPPFPSLPSPPTFYR